MSHASEIKALLLSGAPRSIGGADAVVARVVEEPVMLKALLECLCSDDRTLVARAANAAEKLSRQMAPRFQRYKALLLGMLSEAAQPELRWQLAAMLPRLRLSIPETEHCAAVFRAWLEDRSSLVRTFAMHGLADLLRQNPAPRREVIELLRVYARTGTAAMRARGRILLKELETGESGRMAPHPKGSRQQGG